MDYTLRQGTKAGALEVLFEEIPTAATRDALKGLKMRWNAAKKCWWGFTTAESIAAVIGGEPVQAKAPALQDCKAEYMEILKQHENNWSHWESYYNKKISAAYYIGRYLVAFEKQSIETHFCFGYGYCGVSTTEDMERAHDMAQHARTNENYFISENLKSYDEILACIETVKENRRPIEERGERWTRCGCDIKDIAFFAPYCNNRDRITVNYITYNDDYNHGGAVPGVIDILTDEEIEAYKAAVQIERAKLEKRLHTYLKRYGLSKLHTWSYLSD